MKTHFTADSKTVGRCILGVMAVFMILTVLSACDYARMRDDEAMQTYEGRLPEMAKKAIPISGGLEVLRQSKPDDLHNPIAVTAESVERGRERYQFYCVPCHGPKGDGLGTVGQSFAPLPTSLVSSDVQDQSDGQLFYNISLGINRHPPLAATVAVGDRWAVINYLRHLGSQQKGS
jgi:mono/diheme cytochrome c family protein